MTTVLTKANVKSICVDSKNNIWIGADTAKSRDQSLYWLDRRNNQFLTFLDPNSGSHINGIFDIMEDDKRNLWVSTTNAIFKINCKRDELRKYGENSGVHRNNFVNGDNFKSGNGLLFFGDALGYYSFFPDDLKDNTQPLLNFTSFKLNGNEVFPSRDGVLKDLQGRYG
jgi:ligand-binding sensor domain-containing protein